MNKGNTVRRKGVDTRARDSGGVGCMVVGCSGPAIYRGRRAMQGRGYCSKHKHLAVSQLCDKTRQAIAEDLEWFIERPAGIYGAGIAAKETE